MARKSSGKPKGESKSGSAGRAASGAGKSRIKREQDTSQLLERGEGPSEGEVLDPEVGSPSEITSEDSGTSGEGGYSTLGGGVYPDEGDPDDAPSHGDWQRHSTGASSGARGQEGVSFPGEHTWGESQFRRERQIEQRGSAGDRRVSQRRRPDEALASELQEILTKDPELNAKEIEVEVEGGAVRLSGFVDSSDARLLAEELVESVAGVREVHNNLKVAR